MRKELGEDEEGLEEKLVQELDEHTQPRKAWEATREEIQTATEAVRANKSYKSKVQGPDLIDRIEDYAIELYTAIGEQGNGNKKILAHRLKNILGQLYDPFAKALGRGDISEANSYVSQAFQQQYTTAHLSASLQKLESLDPESRIKAWKKLTKLLGPDATDYVKALSDPGRFLENLSKVKSAAENYST